MSETGVSLGETAEPTEPINTEEDAESARFRILNANDEEIMAGLTGLAEEVAGMRRDLAELREYIVELETKAQAMASPEAMQEMMTKFMSGGM